MQPLWYRGVSGGWAIANPVFGRIEGAAHITTCPASYAPVMEWFVHPVNLVGAVIKQITKLVATALGQN